MVGMFCYFTAINLVMEKAKLDVPPSEFGYHEADKKYHNVYLGRGWKASKKGIELCYMGLCSSALRIRK